MDIDQTLSRVEAYQRALLERFERGTALLALPASDARDPLAHGRWILVRMLQEYQVFKHRCIFDPAIRSGMPAKARAATRMKADCIAAGEAYRAHVREWSATDVAARWSEYQVAMRAMVNRLRAHLAAERRAIADLYAAGPPRRLAG